MAEKPSVAEQILETPPSGNGGPTGTKVRKPTTRKKRRANQPSRQSGGKTIDRPFPRVTLEDALKVAIAIKEKNAGNPYASEDVAAALKIGAKGGRFFYLTAGARDYGLTTGTRETEKISLTELGRTAVIPRTPLRS